jgi:hypothetical protein
VSPVECPIPSPSGEETRRSLLTSPFIHSRVCGPRLERPFFLQLGCRCHLKKRRKVESQTPSHTVCTCVQPKIRRMMLILFSNDFDNAEPRMGRTRWYSKRYPMAKPIIWAKKCVKHLIF